MFCIILSYFCVYNRTTIQKLLENAEKRSKEFGLSAPSPRRLPLCETNSDNGNESVGAAGQTVALKKINSDTYLHSSPRSTTKVTRQFSTTEQGSKENDVEINITAPSNVQVCLIFYLSVLIRLLNISFG